MQRIYWCNWLCELWLVDVGWESDAEIVKIKDVIRLSSANLIRSQIFRLLIAAFSIAKTINKGNLLLLQNPPWICAASKNQAPCMVVVAHGTSHESVLGKIWASLTKITYKTFHSYPETWPWPKPWYWSWSPNGRDQCNTISGYIFSLHIWKFMICSSALFQHILGCAVQVERIDPMKYYSCTCNSPPMHVNVDAVQSTMCNVQFWNPHSAMWNVIEAENLVLLKGIGIGIELYRAARAVENYFHRVWNFWEFCCFLF